MHKRFLTIVIAFAATSTVRADTSLRPELAKVATSIKKLLDSRSVESIAVGQFTGPAGHDTNFGPGIEDALTQELRTVKIKVDPDAAFKVQGEFVKGFVKDAARPSDVILLKMNFRIFDRAGDPVTEIPVRVEVRNITDLTRIMGLTGMLSPKGDYYQRNEELQKLLKDKTVFIDGAKVSSDKKSPFAIEIAVRPDPKADAKSRPAILLGKEAYVSIERGETYEVIIHNKSDYEAAITLHIDGLDVFAFSELRDPKTGQPKYTHFFIPAKSTQTIYGWHKRNEPPDNILSFLVTEYGKGASRLAPRPSGKIGVITVTFAYSWEDKAKAPADERSATGNETGFGAPVSAVVEEVQRYIGLVRDVVSIRYSR